MTISYLRNPISLCEKCHCYVPEEDINKEMKVNNFLFCKECFDLITGNKHFFLKEYWTDLIKFKKWKCVCLTLLLWPLYWPPVLSCV